MRRVSGLQRVRNCGRPLGMFVNVVTGNRGAMFDGVEQCHSVWACPVCSAAIRSKRSSEITLGVGAHLAEGGGAYLVTLTVPHYGQDDIGKLWDAVTKSWSSMMDGAKYYGGKRTSGLVNECGIVGTIRTVEVTYGRNGWHPHIHALVLTRRPLESLERLVGYFDRHWPKQIFTRLLRLPNEHGVDVRPCNPVQGADAVLAYVGKLELGGSWPVGMELARGDLKHGRAGGYSPFELAHLAAMGDTQAAQLWQDYEAASKGRRCVQFSHGLRKMFKGGESVEAPEIFGALLRLPRKLYDALPDPGELLQAADLLYEQFGPSVTGEWLAERYGGQACDFVRPERKPLPRGPALKPLRSSSPVR